MDSEQVLKIGMDALLKTNKEMGAAHADRSGDFIERWHRRRDVHFARLVHNAALEEAKAACLAQANEPECPERAQYCADEIERLKELRP